MKQRAPRRLVRHDGPDEVGSTDRQVQRDRRPGARPDHHGTRCSQRVQEGRGVAGVDRDRADRATARTAVPAPVVRDHASDASQLIGERAPRGSGGTGRWDQQDRQAVAPLLVVEIGFPNSDGAHGQPRSERGPKPWRNE